MCLAVLQYEQFCRSTNRGAKILMKSVLLHEIIFFVSVYSAAVRCRGK